MTRGEAGIDTIPPAECGPLREAEQRAAARSVGVDVVEFLDHADGSSSTAPHCAATSPHAIRRHRPELVITGNLRRTWPGATVNQADHRAVGLPRSTRSRTRATGGSSPNPASTRGLVCAE